MEGVEAALRKLVTEVGRAINTAQDAVNVVVPLRVLASLLRDDAVLQGRSIGGTNPASVTSFKALDEIATLCRGKAWEAFPESPPEQVLSCAFYGGSCFTALAQLLLHKVAVDWLACFSLLEQTILFDDFFTHAPLNEAVSVLVHGLSLQHVSEEDEGTFAVDSPSAARAQAERLLVLILISRQGVKKLYLSFSSPIKVFPEAEPNPRSVLASYRQQNSQLAQLLSSMPERASLQAPAALKSPLYIQSVVSQLLAACQENWTSLSTNGNCSQVSSSDEALKFGGEVIGGLCRRGHADVIVTQMVPSLMQHILTAASSGAELANNQHCYSSVEEVIEKLQLSIWPNLAASITDSHALERFSDALLKEIGTKADVTDWQAYCIMHTLYGKLIKERATTRSLFTEKFLFGKVLPIRCLRWVLDFAVLYSPPAADHWVQPGKKESTVERHVVRRLAEGWAAKEFIQSAPVQHQAYLTAALGICLGPLNKEMLERIDGLVPSLMKGISNRLGSAINPVRQMAKRIALAFSTAMDPENPLLFDEGDTIEDLLHWEGLEQVSVQKLAPSGTEMERKQITAKVETQLDEEHTGVSIHGDDKGRKHERRMLRKAKKEKLALEEDDPDAVVRLGEESSDEESELSSESDSESDSALQPYNMSDDDDDDGGRGKVALQLSDLATKLRKGDKPDEVEEALQAAEKLVLAMPEELDGMAADLTHALVHVKCSAVTIEGEEDIAEERRHRALVALLSCSPLQSVSVLTADLFSQHVDASQRILILDVMAAGARALARGTPGDKSSDEDRRKRLITNVPGTIDQNSWYAPGEGSGRMGAGPWVEVSSPVPGGTLVGWAHRYERELPARPGQRPLGRSRRWGQRAMQMRKDERIGNSNLPHKNRFAPLAAAFMLPVMRDYDKKRQHLVLLDRDFLVLGGILSMLGVCMECISMQREAGILGAGLLEMLRLREISSHPETFVRRTALFAASRVLAALHPSDVVASLTAGMSSIAANLEWVREWALEIAINDTDTDCSMMATACVQLHSEMALQVQRSLGSLDSSAQTLEAKIQSNPSIIMPF